MDSDAAPTAARDQTVKSTKRVFTTIVFQRAVAGCRPPHSSQTGAPVLFNQQWTIIPFTLTSPLTLMLDTRTL